MRYKPKINIKELANEISISSFINNTPMSIKKSDKQIKRLFFNLNIKNITYGDAIKIKNENKRYDLNDMILLKEDCDLTESFLNNVTKL